MISAYLDPRSLTRLTGFAAIAGGAFIAWARVYASPEMLTLVNELAGDTSPATMIGFGLGLIGIKAAIAKAQQ